MGNYYERERETDRRILQFYANAATVAAVIRKNWHQRLAAVCK